MAIEVGASGGQSERLSSRCGDDDRNDGSLLDGQLPQLNRHQQPSTVRPCLADSVVRTCGTAEKVGYACYGCIGAEFPVHRGAFGAGVEHLLAALPAAFVSGTTPKLVLIGAEIGQITPFTTALSPHVARLRPKPLAGDTGVHQPGPTAGRATRRNRLGNPAVRTESGHLGLLDRCGCVPIDADTAQNRICATPAIATASRRF
jgi:hypothetical protein